MNITLLNLFDSELAVNVTLCGLVIVFSMLIFLVLVISVFGKIMVLIQNKKLKKATNADMGNNMPLKAKENNADTANEITEEETVAAISAAVAYIYKDSSVTPKIKSIRPFNGNKNGGNTRSAWAKAGIENNMRSFY